MEHAEFEERVAEYLTGGLSPIERAGMEAHAAVCGACAATLQEAMDADRRVERLFVDQRPDAGFEDRIVRKFRLSKGRGMSLRLVHPAVPRAVSGIAAALVLGACGYFASGLIDGGRLPFASGGKPHSVALSSASQPATQPGFGNHRWYFKESSLAGENEGQQWDESEIKRYRSPAEVAQKSQERLERRLENLTVSAGGAAGAYNLRTSTLSDDTLDKRGGARWGWAAENAKRKARDSDGTTPSNAEGIVLYSDMDSDPVGRFDISNNQLVITGDGGEKQLGQVRRSLVQARGREGDKPASDVKDLDAFGAIAVPQTAAPVEVKDAEAAGAEASAVRSKSNLGDDLADTHANDFAMFDQPADRIPVDSFYAGVSPAPAAKPVETAAYFVPAPASIPVTNAEHNLRGSLDGKAGKDLKELADVRQGITNGTSSSSAGTLLARGGAKLAQNTPAEPTAPGQQPQAGQGKGGPSAPPVNNFQSAVGQPVAQQIQQQQAPAQAMRKIIRNGEMEFEVESFDSSFVTITKIVTEDGGFVSSTNSEKLPNGKVKGTIIVRVPPDRLDTFVLKLRALGDLKSQKISAQDVTKVYYDLESELKAGRAMEERLLNIIKSGKGEIKDLLEAEKQLGVYREKIEKLEGEIRYYNNLVSMSTMSITVYEKDIKTPAYAAQTETVGMGIETDAVEKARAEALKAIEEAKGRITESNLKQHDAGQLAATIVAEVSPDAAGPLIDRLKQLGRVARLDVDRKTSTPSGISAPAPTRVERKDTQFSISIYNLANVAPRQTTNASMAVANVEEAYKTVLALVRDKTGRIVTSTLNRQKPEQTTAQISFEVPSADAEATLTEIRREREVLGLTVTENPDTNNVTTAKRGFSIQIQSLATVPPRETEQLVLTSKTGVAEAFNKLVAEARKADARILVSQLNEQDKSNITASLDIEVLRTKEVDLRAALATNTDTVSRQINRASEAENTVDSKVRLQMRLMSIDRMAARETRSMGLAAADVSAAYQGLLSALAEQGARIISSQLNEKDPRNVVGTLDFEVPRDKQGTVEKALTASGVIHSRSVARSTDRQNSVDSKVRMQVQVSNISQLAPRQTTTLMLEVKDVEQRTAEVLSQAESAGGRTVQSTQSKTTDGRMTSQIVVDLPLAEAQRLRDQVQGMGEVRFKESSTDPKAPEGPVARGRLDITLASPEALVGRDEGLSASMRHAISMSLKGLWWSLSYVLMGLLVIGPWALLLWGAWKLLRKKPKPVTVAA
jgi:hypothetical protein